MFQEGPCIIYTSPHVPAEWIAAHGCVPCRITPETGINSTHSGMGVCPYAAAVVRSMLQHPDAAGIVLTTSCDQIRRQAELLAKATKRSVFLLHVPTAVEAPTALPLYREEILRLGRFLETCGGNTPSHLAATMSRYDVARNKLRTSRNMLRGRSFSAALMRWQRGDWSVLDMLSPETTAPSDVPLALVGSPLRESDLCLFDEIEAAGGQVVLDATTTGERSLPPPFDHKEMQEHPLDILLAAYLHIPDAFQRPNTNLYQYLKTTFKIRGVRGVILRHYTWCDTWQIEAARLEEGTKLPILHLDVGEEDDSTRQMGRIQAFLEMLS